MTDASPRIALIGFSEAGQALAAGLTDAGARVTAADIRMKDPALRAAAEALGIDLRADAASAGAEADIIFSAVTAGAARAVAEDAAGWLASGQTFLDLNSTGPADKQACAAAVAPSGADFVEGAIMSPVAGHGHAAPILLAGASAARLAEALTPLGMRVEVAGETLGAASAAKMCRSIVMKGIEAIVTESLLAARHWRVDDLVLASLAETYPGIDWPSRSRYLLTRVMQHGARRAQEMTAAAEAVTAAGIEPTLAEAIAALQAWAGDVAPDGGFDLDGDCRALVDRLAAAARERGS